MRKFCDNNRKSEENWQDNHFPQGQKCKVIENIAKIITTNKENYVITTGKVEENWQDNHLPQGQKCKVIENIAMVIITNKRKLCDNNRKS